MFIDLDQAIESLRAQDYQIEDPWDVVDVFEEQVAEYAGSKFAVAVDNCTNAIFLCLKYLRYEGEIILPTKTYVSVPQTVIHAGCTVKFDNIEWTGLYRLEPTNIYDSATRFTKGMYIQDSFQCLSFHIKKTLGITKGGMILTNDEEARDWFKRARYEGRDNRVSYDQDIVDTLGWNMYMPPEQAARGIQLLEKLSSVNEDCGGSWMYHDISNYPCFKK